MRFVVVLLFTACASVARVDTQALLGDWCAGSEDAFHEELSFVVEADVNVFFSWLHHRPAGSGRWEIRDSILTMHGSSGDETVYTIVSLSRDRLRLRRSDGVDEVYVRRGCRPFNPRFVE